VTSPIQLLKNKLRQEMKIKLAALTPWEYHSLNNIIEQRFFSLPVLQNSHQIMLYYSIQYEVATLSIILKLLDAGKTVSLPACIDRTHLRAGIIQSLDELVPGVYGIHEPLAAAQEMDPVEIDLVVVPGVAFEQKGFRLGHGAGYYDRFLAGTKAYKLGFAYDFQIIDNLVVEPHDVPMDGLLTPSIFQEIRS